MNHLWKVQQKKFYLIFELKIRSIH